MPKRDVLERLRDEEAVSVAAAVLNFGLGGPAAAVFFSFLGEEGTSSVFFSSFLSDGDSSESLLEDLLCSFFSSSASEAPVVIVSESSLVADQYLLNNTVLYKLSLVPGSTNEKRAFESCCRRVRKYRATSDVIQLSTNEIRACYEIKDVRSATSSSSN